MEDKSKSIKYPYIPEDVMVNIEVSGYFIHRSQKLLLALSNQLTKEELLKTFEDIRDDKPAASVEAETIGFLTALVEAMEKSASEQNKIKIVDTTHEHLEKYFTNKGII